ncbi:MAG: hypothetical protein DRJ60_03710 [Thermoprotei archaeon]|nr:MAG: hypothetical protein DRJ60_03710 [Thermoprotei archaeon]
MEKKLLSIITFVIIIIILCCGCIKNDNCDNSHDKKEEFLVIRIESIDIINKTNILKPINIYFQLDEDKKNITYNETQWTNEIRLDLLNADEKYFFNVSLSNEKYIFRFAGKYSFFNGHIHFKNEMISIDINPQFKASYEIEKNKLYSDNQGFNINITGEDGSIEILIAIEHTPP